METVKDYLDKLEIKNSILAKQLKETYINRVVYFKEDRVKQASDRLRKRPPYPKVLRFAQAKHRF